MYPARLLSVENICGIHSHILEIRIVVAEYSYNNDVILVGKMATMIVRVINSHCVCIQEVLSLSPESKARLFAYPLYLRLR